MSDNGDFEKLGVVEDDDAAVKTATDKKVCPVCGSPLEENTNVLKCPRCGTKPFESTDASTR